MKLFALLVLAVALTLVGCQQSSNAPGSTNAAPSTNPPAAK